MNRTTCLNALDALVRRRCTAFGEHATRRAARDGTDGAPPRSATMAKGANIYKEKSTFCHRCDVGADGKSGLLSSTCGASWSKE